MWVGVIATSPIAVIFSHHSGDIHWGLLYTLGSMKPRLCLEEGRAVYEPCAEIGIAFDAFGELVTAAEPSELPILEESEDRARRTCVVSLISEFR